VKDLKLGDLRGLMGNVNQEPILFNDTIASNIAFGVQDATPAQIMAAAMVANAHEFIMQTENGYDTNIGDRGAKLSGGQRQRVAIARALVNNPSLLLADEPTGNLDSQISEEIMKLFADIHRKGNTLVVVTHEHDIAMHAHRIIRLKDGEVETDEINPNPIY